MKVCQSCNKSFEGRKESPYCSRKCYSYFYDTYKRKIYPPIKDLENEIWEYVDSVDNLYMVSNLGRVKSFSRDKVNGHIISPSNINGYDLVVVSINTKRHCYKVHRWVAQAFIPNIDNKPFVNHINSIRNDNRVENLEWCTQKENIVHAWNNNRCNPTHGSKCHSAKITERDVLDIRILYKKGIKIKDIAEKYSLYFGNVRKICIGETWKRVPMP